MKTLTATITTGLMLISGACSADDVEMQANSLFNIYQSTCMKHVNNMDELRSKLNKLPKLPPEKAANFLHGKAESAWPVPDKYGLFVVVVHEDKNLCLVYARRANAAIVERKFVEIFDQAPAPLNSVRIIDERKDSKGSGPIHSIAFSWATPKVPRKMVFMLSTATNPDAQLQATISASTTKD